MIEKTILDYLTAEMSVPVYMEFPEIPPESYVVMTKVGSSRTNLINSATLEFQCVSTSLLNAATLCDELKAVMDGAAILSEVSRARFAGDYNATFTASKSYRYKAVYEVTHY